ncbi:MAG: hypothetical protein IPN22_09615 [Bacteroidetes bacterium]|nr:hypothetical protein [Bacteroidota bacterium]
MKKIIAMALLAFTIAGCSGCKKGGFNVFSVEDDKNFGPNGSRNSQRPGTVSILSQSQYPQAPPT